MSKILDFKFKVYRRYRLDLWSSFILYYSKYKHKFVYKNIFYKYKRKLLFFRQPKSLFFFSNFQIIFQKHSKKRKRLSFLGKRLVLFRKFKMFYGNLPLYQFKKLAKAKLILKNSLAINFLLNLERRIEFILYRLGFMLDPFEARQFLRFNCIIINGVSLINCRNRLMGLNDVISFNCTTRKLLKKKYKVLIKSKKLLFPISNFFDFDLKTFTIRFLGRASFNNFLYPFKLSDASKNAFIAYLNRI